MCYIYIMIFVWIVQLQILFFFLPTSRIQNLSGLVNDLLFSYILSSNANTTFWGSGAGDSAQEILWYLKQESKIKMSCKLNTDILVLITYFVGKRPWYLQDNIFNVAHSMAQWMYNLLVIISYVSANIV